MEPNSWVLRSRLARARSMVGSPIRYRLGHGGFHPSDPLPSRTGFCDCSGFVAWVLGLSRRPKITRLWWIESTAVHRDATGRQSVFVRLDEPLPGCVVVVPDRGLSQGHMAIYVGQDGRSKSPRVVDCSASVDGIAEHIQRAFLRPDAVFCTLRQDATL